METASRRPVDPRQDRASPRGLGGDTRRAGRQRSRGGRATASRAIVRGWTALSRPLRSRSAAAPVALRALSAADDSSTCFLISTLLLRALSRNQVSKKTLGRRRLAQAAMAHRDTSVSALCRELGISPVTLYRHVGPQGQLREQGEKVLAP